MQQSASRDDEVPGNNAPARMAPADHQPVTGHRLYKVWVKFRPEQEAFVAAVNRKQAIAAAQRMWPGVKGIRAALYCPAQNGQPPQPCREECPGACRRGVAPARAAEVPRGAGYVPDFAYS